MPTKKNLPMNICQRSFVCFYDQPHFHPTLPWFSLSQLKMYCINLALFAFPCLWVDAFVRVRVFSVVCGKDIFRIFITQSQYK